MATQAFTVTTVVDTYPDTGIGTLNSDGSRSGSLREALNFANQNVATAPGDVTTITVDPSLKGKTIFLQGNLPLVATSTTINGNGVILDGRPSADGVATYRGFLVTGVATTSDGTPPAITVGISDLAIRNVLAQGGTGADGGGGGMGAGGAVFVGENANVTLTSVDVSGAEAKGGTGGQITDSPHGAGGGLGGAGGTGGGGTGGGGGLLFAGGNGADNSGGGGGGITGSGRSGGSSPAGGPGLAGVGGGGGGYGGFGYQAVGGPGGGQGALSGGNRGGDGGKGGFGGGGGGIGESGSDGQGGFGGGGGGSYGNGGTGGFGGGGGSFGGGGFGGGGGLQQTGGVGASSNIGDGLSAGGAIFVVGRRTSTDDSSTVISGGSLTVIGGSFADDAVTPSNDANPGAAVGQDLFLMTGSNDTLATAQGTILTLSRTIADDSAISLPAGGSYTAGTGAGGALTVGAAGQTGTVVLSSANTYAGGTALNAGALDLGNSAALGSGALAMAQGTTLGFAASGLTVANAISLNGDPTFDVEPAQSPETISGVISNSTATGATPGELVKTGAGTLVLTNADTYSGATTVQAGTLLVNGSIANSTTTVGNGGTLGGSGQTGAVTVQSGGKLSPGNSPGILNTKDLSLASGATYVEQIGGPTAGNSSGNYDQTNVTGTVNLNSGNTAGGGATLSASFVNGYTPTAGQTYTIINNDGQDAVVGDFRDTNGKDLTEGSTVTVGGVALVISYKGGDGNDVTLTDPAPPPPAPSPTPASNPTITGTYATTDAGEATVAPFGASAAGGPVTIADTNADATDSLTITLSGGGGTLSGKGLSGSGTSYMLAATDPGTLTAELDALTFMPTAGAPGAANPTTFQLAVASSAGTSATDSGTVVTDTAATTPARNPIPVAPGSGGVVGVTPADTVSLSNPITYANGIATITGTASSAAGVAGVEITADVNGTPTDLGPAAVDASGNFSFKDTVGASMQTFFSATETDGAGGQATSTDPGFSLQGGLSNGRAEQFRYTPDGSAVAASDVFKTNGSQDATLSAPGGETFASSFFDTFHNGEAPRSTFVFNPGFGRDVVDGFRPDDVDHDTLSFKGSDFGTTPAAQLAAVLADAQDTKAGLLITDPTPSSPGAGPGHNDTLLLRGITKDQLTQYQNQDIAFHA